MKCNRCGNEFYAGNICPNCGTVMNMNNDEGATIAYNQEISVKLDEQGNMDYGQSRQNVYSHGTPQPLEGIFASSNMYGAQGTSGQGMSNQGMYGNFGMNGQGVPNQSMYGTQGMNGQNMPNQSMYGTQGMNGQSVPLSQGMYGNGNMGGQNIPQSMSPNMSNSGMYGYSQNPSYGNNPYAPNNQEPKKSKTPFIIAGIVLALAVIAIILILVLVVFKEDDDTHDDERTTAATTESISTESTTEDDVTTEKATETETTSEEAKTDEQKTDGNVVFSDDKIELTFDKAYMSKYGEFTIEGKAKNKTDGKIGLGLDASDIDGISINSSFYASVDAGGTDTWTFTAEADGLAVAGIKKISNVNIEFSLYDGETYADIYEDSLQISCDVDTNLDKAPKDDEWVVVYKDDYCEVAALNRISEDMEYDYYNEYFRITNKTDTRNTIMITNTVIDGKKVTEYGGYLDVRAKATAYVKLYWDKKDFEAVPKFGEIQADFDFYTTKDYNGYTETDITIKTNGIVK